MVTTDTFNQNEDQGKIINKMQSFEQMIVTNNIGDREKIFMRAVANLSDSAENLTQKPKIIRQPSYSEFGILNYDNGIFKKKRTVSHNSNESFASSNGATESDDKSNKFNKTQSCGNFYRNNFGDRENIFRSGIVNNQNGIQEDSIKNPTTMVRPPSYSEFGILNYENGIFKKHRTISNNSNESSESTNIVSETGTSKGTNKIIINKTQSCGNVFYRNEIGNREKLFMSGIIKNQNEIPENAEVSNRKLVRQPSYVENGILNYESQTFASSNASEGKLEKLQNENAACAMEIGILKNPDASMKKTQSVGNIVFRNHGGEREKIFINGILNNKNEIPAKENSSNRVLIRVPSYKDVGIFNYKSQAIQVPSDASKELNKTKSCGNIFHRNHIGDREKIFMSAIMTKTISEKQKTAPRELVRQPSYAEFGILNYEPQVFKRQPSAINHHGTNKEEIRVPNQEQILAKAQSCGNMYSRNTIGDRENIFVSGIINNRYENENQKPAQRELIRQPSYADVGILNYEPQVFKTLTQQGTTKEENKFINKEHIFNKTQSCGNVFAKHHIGDREAMFINGIVNNNYEVPGNKGKLRPLVRQPSYAEVGILNYEPQVIKRQNTVSTSSYEDYSNQNERENNAISPNKIFAKTQSCGIILPRSHHIGDREKIFTLGIMNNISSENMKPTRELVRQPSYAEVGILNYEPQIFKRQSSYSSSSSEDNGNVLEALRGEFTKFKTCTGENSSNGDLSNEKEDSTAKEETPARSRIIARVKKSRSFALLQDTNNELPALPAATESERRVLVIYTGGTIGMVKNSDGVLAPIKGAFEGTARTFPQLHDETYWWKRFVYDEHEKINLVLPVVKDLDARVIYKIREKEQLLDSSNITAEDWIEIARDVKNNYDYYDGFVILHGTDTLAYTASALSFMLENIGKPVVITGSQIPIFEPRSDGADNFVSALIVAGGLHIPEVTVLFGSKLLRGNRTSKISSHNFDAFDSPNFVPLVEFGIDIEVNSKAIFRPTRIEKMNLHEKMSKNVGILRIFPSISTAVLRAFFQPPIEGVVLETYGSGNIPSRGDIFKEIEAAVKRGVIVVNITQCASGSVSAPVYETGRLIHACGVISGYDMTSETALAKLSYVLSKDEWSHEKKIEMMTSNIRGELTNLNSITIDDNSLIDALASSLKISSPKQLIEVTDKVFTALLLYAIDKEEEVTIQTIQGLGAEVNSENTEGKTPLHVAINKENVHIVKYLLLRGANVHVKTRSGESPLLTAIQRDNHAIIKLLMNCGAHLASSDNQAVTELLSLAARRGSVQRLRSLRLAGADLNLRDEMRQTALHKAVLSNQPEAVNYLLQQGVERNVYDVLNMSPLDYARRLDSKELISLLE